MLNQTNDGNNPLVFDFQAIFNAWLQGKCTTKYLHLYINETVVNSFIKELERMKDVSATK
jgi:hypothetical protein